MSESDLQAIEQHFHTLIREVSLGLSDEHRVSLPTVSDLLASVDEALWLPIPGMAGGFSYCLNKDKTVLTVESWCRIVEGSGLRHEITKTGYTLVAEGFV